MPVHQIVMANGVVPQNLMNVVFVIQILVMIINVLIVIMSPLVMRIMMNVMNVSVAQQM